MPDTALIPRSALAGIAAGRHGAQNGRPGLVLQEAAGVAIVGIAARRGQEAAVIDAVRQEWGVPLPATPRVVEARGISFLWSGAGQWLALAGAPVTPGALEAELRQACGGAASLTAQGDGRLVLRLGGPAVRDVLAALVPIDLHPRVFRVGDTAMTLLNHVGVQLRQIDASPHFELIAFRGYALSLFETVLEAGSRFGVEVLPPG